MIIYPEGGTTNGKCLIEFKKGAFAGLNSVQPIGLKYHTLYTPMANGCMPYLNHILLCIFNPWATCEVIELPVFRPNDYFFENHMKEGEEKF